MFHAGKRFQKDISDLRATQSELRRDLEALQKAWKDELVDLLDLREQVINHLRRLAARAQFAPEAETPDPPAPDAPELDPISKRVLERRQSHVRSLSGRLPTGPLSR